MPLGFKERKRLVWLSSSAQLLNLPLQLPLFFQLSTLLPSYSICSVSDEGDSSVLEDVFKTLSRHTRAAVEEGLKNVAAAVAASQPQLPPAPPVVAAAVPPPQAIPVPVAVPVPAQPVVPPVAVPAPPPVPVAVPAPPPVPVAAVPAVPVAPPVVPPVALPPQPYLPPAAVPPPAVYYPPAPAAGVPGYLPPVAAVPAAVPVPPPVAVQSIDTTGLFLVVGVFVFLCFMFIWCVKRGMQGKLDIDPDVITGKTAQTTLSFRMPGRGGPADGEGDHNPAYSDHNIDNNLAPPPANRRSRQKSGGRSDHSATDESICMDFE